MNVSMSAGEAADALKVAGLAVANKAPLPVLKNILVTANSKVTFAATDLDTSIECSVEGKVSKEGSCCVEADTISQLVMAMESSSELHLIDSAETNKLALMNGTSVYKLPTLKAEDYPSLEVVKEDDIKVAFELSLGELKECIRRTLFAVSQEDSKPTLTGECWEVGEEESTIAATDTRRLALMELPAYGHAVQENFIVPSKALNFIRNMTGDDSDEVLIVASENLISFTSPMWRLVNRLIAGKYPDYKRIIPGEPSVIWRIPTANLMASLRRLRVLTKDHKTRADMTLFEGKGDSLRIAAVGYDPGDGLETLDMSVEGEDFKIALNAKFLMEILAVCDDLVEMRMTESLSPAILVSGEKWQTILMPMDPGGVI